MSVINVDAQDCAVVDGTDNQKNQRVESKAKMTIVELIDSLDDEIFVHYNRYGRIEPKPKEKDELVEFVDELLAERKNRAADVEEKPINADIVDNGSLSDIRNEAGLKDIDNGSGRYRNNLYMSKIQNHNNKTLSDIQNDDVLSDIHNESKCLSDIQNHNISLSDIQPVKNDKEYDNNNIKANIDSLYMSDIQTENKNDNGSDNNDSDICLYMSEIREKMESITPRHIDILRAYAAINARRQAEEEWRSWKTGRVYQQDDFANTIRTEEELWLCLKQDSRKSRLNLERLYDFCCIVERYMSDGVIEEVGISTRGGGLEKRFSHSGAADMIRRAEKLDIVVCTDSEYSRSLPVPGSKRKTRNGTSRRFIINPLMVELVKRTYIGEAAASEERPENSTSRPENAAGENERESELTEEEAGLVGRRIRFGAGQHLPAVITDE